MGPVADGERVIRLDPLLPFRRRLAECRGNVGLDQRRVCLWRGCWAKAELAESASVAAKMIILMSRLLSA